MRVRDDVASSVNEPGSPTFFVGDWAHSEGSISAVNRHIRGDARRQQNHGWLGSEHQLFYGELRLGQSRREPPKCRHQRQQKGSEYQHPPRGSLRDQTCQPSWR